MARVCVCCWASFGWQAAKKGSLKIFGGILPFFLQNVIFKKSADPHPVGNVSSIFLSFLLLADVELLELFLGELLDTSGSDESVLVLGSDQLQVLQVRRRFADLKNRR